jgi:hypothetical protein
MNGLAAEQSNSQNDVPQYPHSGDRVTPKCGVIQVHLRRVSQLFDALDPSPFREKDLDRNAEEYIVDSVKEFPSRAPCALVIHLDEVTGLAEEREIGNAIRVHFSRRSRLLRRDLHKLLRRGLLSLGIGATFLVVFFVVAQMVGRLMGESGWGMLFREGLVIVGWVAMWRPLEIFLYDWWPIVGERQLHERLSRIEVRVFHKGSSRTNSTQAISQNATAAAMALARWEWEGGRIAATDLPVTGNADSG